MRCFLLLSAFGVAVLAAPQGYEYKEPAPVNERNGFQPITLPRSLPCKHASQNFNDAASALIQSQSTARIVNHQNHYSADHNLVSAASGYSGQSQHMTADKASFNQGATQTFQAGHGYVQNGGAFVTQVQPQIQAQPFNSVSVGSGQHLASAFKQGYVYNQQNGQHNIHQHNQHNFGAINSPPQNLARPPVYPLPANGRPIVPGLLGNLAAPRPVQSYSNGNSNNQNGISGYAGSFHHIGHSSLHAESTTSSHNVNHAANGGSSFNFGNAGSFLTTGAGDALNGQLGHVIRETFANAPLDPSAEKHIYVHVPPEDLEETHNQQYVAQQQLAVPSKKHYKIIFIKAPSAPAPNYSQLAAAVAPQTEEKTLVYVLVKKPDEPSLEQIQQIQQSSYKSSKPEVYFIKYKTRKENEAGQYSANSQNPSELFQPPQHTGAIANDDSDLIDIRSGGENSSISSSTSYTSSSTGGISDGPKHELYGVPLN